MALDFYVGTLMRYMTHRYMTSGMHWSIESDSDYVEFHHRKMVTFKKEELQKREVEVFDPNVQAAVGHYWERLNAKLALTGHGPVKWDEAKGRPYNITQPIWEGYSALILWAAYEECPDLTPPKAAPRLWYDDPAWLRLGAEDRVHKFETILFARNWIPIEFPHVFECEPPFDEAPWIGSIFSMKKELALLRELTADKLVDLDAEDLEDSEEEWEGELEADSETDREPGKQGKESSTHSAPVVEAEPYGSEGYEKPPLPQPESDYTPLAHAASYALPILEELVEFACRERLPMVMDFPRE